MKKNLLLLFLSIAIFSCSSNDEDSNLITDLTGKLKSTQKDGEERIYNYNNYGFITEITTNKQDNFNMKYTYEGNKIVSMLGISNGLGIGENYIYSGNLISQSVSLGDYFQRSNDFFYDSSGFLVKTIRYTKEGNAPRKETSIEEYTYVNGNLVSETITITGTGEIFLSNYEYDDKKNPIYASFPDAFNKIIIASKNNIIKLTNENDGVKFYQYEYNDLGFPIKSVSNGEVETYQYN